MSMADDLQKLRDLHASGGLTDAEYAAAKAAVLAGQAAPAAEDTRDELAELKQQTDLIRLDQEWEREKQRYMIRGKYGHQQIPSRIAGLVIGIGATTFGIIWIVFTSAMTANFPGDDGPGAIFPCFGGVFILFGIGMGIYMFTMAVKYEDAEQRYRRRRAAIRDGRPDPGGW